MSMLVRSTVHKIDLRLRSPHLAILQARNVILASAERAVQLEVKAAISPDTRKAITNEVTTPRFKLVYNALYLHASNCTPTVRT